MRILLLPQARADLEAIQEPLLSRVFRQLENLREFPEMGAAMVGPFLGYRSLTVELFRIVYRIQPKGLIEIAYLRDCRREPLG